MTPHRIAVPALSFLLMTMTAGFGLATASGQNQDAPRLTAYAQDHESWDAPPQDFDDIQRRGFRDGIEAAQKDFNNHRTPDVNNHGEYRNPRLPSQKREAYRDGFLLGYEQGVSHMAGGPMEPVPSVEQQPLPPNQQTLAPSEQVREPDSNGLPYLGQEMDSELQRRAFQDGMDGARKDIDNHRRPNVNNRDEYRNPGVPRKLRADYREAFRRGYDRGFSQLMAGLDQH